jgi:peptidoglycan/LPS O-acetylase OafA/YrhL
MQASKKLLSIDALRGIAALGVAWFHSRVDLWVGFKEIQANQSQYTALDNYISYLSLPISLLGGMVMVFFMLSGFCIHLPNARKGKAPNWWSYAIRRSFRIYPPYLLTLLLCLAITIALPASKADFNNYGTSFLMLQNWLNQGTQIDLNPSLWSIPIEVELYIVYPLLYIIYCKLGGKGAVVLTFMFTIIGIGLLAFKSNIAMTTFFIYTGIWNTGAWLAEKYANGKAPKWKNSYAAIMLAILIAISYATTKKLDKILIDYGWALISYFLIIWAIGPGSRLSNKQPWVKAIVFTGTVSYSLYLLHFPIFRVAGIAWVNHFGAKPASFIIPTIATFLMIPFSHAMYKLIEEPSYNLGKKLSTLQLTV